MEFEFIIGAVIVISVLIVIFVIIANNKLRKEKDLKKSEEIKDKSHEVEVLKLTVEKEKLQTELNQMKAPKHIYCKYCGTKNDADAKRCFKCGVGIEEDF